MKKLHKNWVTLSACLALITFSLLAPLLATQTVEAALAGKWINIGLLEVDGKRYEEDKIDNNWHFYLLGDTDCPDEIDELSYNPDSQNENFALPKDTEVKLQKKERTGSGCTNIGSKETVTLTGNDAARFSFNWVDNATIQIPGKGSKFTKDATIGGLFSKSDDNQCKDTLEPSADNQSLTLIVRVTAKRLDTSDVEYRTDLRVPYQGHSWIGMVDYNTKEGQGCIISDAIPGLPVGFVEKAGAPGAGGPGGPGGAGGPTTADKDSCEKSGENTWFLCPALRQTSSFLQFVDKELLALLSVPSDYYNNPQLEVAWSRIRNVAYILLIPIMLVMILSTAMGFEMFSTYAVKKALPRMVLAVLFIALSLEITSFLIILTNDVGKGILGIVTSAFGNGGTISIASLFDANGIQGFAFSTAAGVGGVLAGGLLGVLISYLFVCGMILLIAVMALALRQMLLLAFMIVAPLAILAWIFPGNDKLWKLWWGSFSKLLLLFPLIMFLIGAGRGFAVIVNTTGGSEFNFIGTVLKLAAYVGPYFFIPYAFKFAGGAFATISGMANDRSKGLFDRQKKYRAHQYTGAMTRAKSGGYFKGGKEGGVRNRLSRGIQRGALINKGGLRPGGMSSAIGAQTLDSSNEFMKTNTFRSISGDDDKMRAVIEGRGNAQATRAALLKSAPDRFEGSKNSVALDNATAEVMRFSKESGGHQVARVSAFRGLATSSTAWNNSKDKETGELLSHDAGGKMLQDLNNVTGDDRTLAVGLLAEARDAQVRAGRVDTGGASFSTTAMEADKLWRKDKIKDKATGQIRDYAATDATEVMSANILKGKSAMAALGEKSQNAEAMAPAMLERLQASFYDEDDPNAGIRALASQAAVLDALGSTSPQNAEIIAKQVHGKTLDVKHMSQDMRDKLASAIVDPSKKGQMVFDPATGQSKEIPVTKEKITVQAAINALRSDDTFNGMRREYSQGYAAEAAGRMVPGQPAPPPPPGP